MTEWCRCGVADWRRCAFHHPGDRLLHPLDDDVITRSRDEHLFVVYTAALGLALDTVKRVLTVDWYIYVGR